MVRRQLHADGPLAGGGEDTVKTVVTEDLPAEHPGPERALGAEISRVEDDDVTDDVHLRERRRAISTP